MAVLILCAEWRWMKKEKSVFQTKEQDNSPETNVDKIKISQYLREFKRKMPTEVRKNWESLAQVARVDSSTVATLGLVPHTCLEASLPDPLGGCPSTLRPRLPSSRWRSPSALSVPMAWTAGHVWSWRDGAGCERSGVSVLVAQSCLILCDPMDFSPPGSSVHVISQARILGGGCYYLLQRIFPTQGSNLGLLHCRQVLYRLSHQGSRIAWGYFPIRVNKSGDPPMLPCPVLVLWLRICVHRPMVRVRDTEHSSLAAEHSESAHLRPQAPDLGPVTQLLWSSWAKPQSC